VVVLLGVLVLVITDVFGEIVFKLPLRSVLLLFADVCIVVVMGLVYLSKNENGWAHDRPLAHVVELH
jgi:hypothetical protein